MNAILASIFLQGGVAVMGNPISCPSQYDYHHVVNPYGTVTVGVEQNVGRWSFSLAGRHISSIATARDNGADTVEFSVKVHPFK
jgi:hypothetical protein